MSFTGDLAHLPIVDVIQLLHSTKKSGTLCINSSKGESQLVFNEGYLVSANHLNNSVRIGQVLIEMNAITQEKLDQALQGQKSAGAARKPLIATLIEQGAIDRDDAYKGLEYLIEMTIVEVLTWTSGTFALDVEKTEMSDEYRYFPETLKQEILLNVQGILMDALRIYDEKMRDGTLESIFFSAQEPESGNQASSGDGINSVTADLLGLDSLDTMKKKIPDVFIGLKDHDPIAENRQIVAEGLDGLATEKQATLSALLNNYPPKPSGSGTVNNGNTLPLAIIMFSSDQFMKHALSTITRHRGHVVFTTDDETNLSLIIEQSFSRDLFPVLIVDDAQYLGNGHTEQKADLMVQQKHEAYPLLHILQLKTSLTDYSFPPQDMEDRVVAVFPRPSLTQHPEDFDLDMAVFLEAFNVYLAKFQVSSERQESRKLRDSVTALSSLREPPEVALALLEYMATQFERVITFVAGATELTAEKAIGVAADKSSGPSGPMLFKIPLGQRSVFQDTIGKKKLYYGICTDPLLKSHLYTQVAPPRSSKIILLPLLLSGNVIALFYGDFGQKTPTPIQSENLEVISRFASLVLDNSFCRKKLDKLTRPI